ncbi:MAG: prepilin peptidase [Sphingorhabdus sp.]
MLLQIPLWAFVLGLTIFGAIWGSFACALCSRWPDGESVVSGRSRCDHCSATLRSTELVPIFSYLLQSGKCRRCGGSIGRATLLVELACAAIGAASAALLPGMAAIAVATFCWLLVPLAILDWRHLWLPDRLIAALAIGGLLLGHWLAGFALVDRLIGAAIGFLALELLRLGFARLRGIEGMGKGDPKLLGAIGLWLGWPFLPAILLLASAIGLGHYLFAAKLQGTKDLRFPLGSYMALGTILSLIATT